MPTGRGQHPVPDPAGQAARCQPGPHAPPQRRGTGSKGRKHFPTPPRSPRLWPKGSGLRGPRAPGEGGPGPLAPRAALGRGERSGDSPTRSHSPKTQPWATPRQVLGKQLSQLQRKREQTTQQAARSTTQLKIVIFPALHGL